MRYVSVLLVIVFVAMAVPASAGDRGFYVGGGLGFSSFDPDDFNPDYGDLRFEEENFGLKVFGGYQILRFLAVEVSYNDFGNVKRWQQHELQLHHQELNVGINAFDASVVGILPVGKKVDLFAKVGVASWDADIRLSIDHVTEDQSISGTDVTFGVGIDFLFKKLGVRFEADWLEISDTNGAFMITVNLTYHF